MMDEQKPHPKPGGDTCEEKRRSGGKDRSDKSGDSAGPSKDHRTFFESYDVI